VRLWTGEATAPGPCWDPLGAQCPWWSFRSPGLPGPLGQLSVPEPSSPHLPAGAAKATDTGEKLPDRRVAKTALISDQIPQKLDIDHGNTSW